MSGTSLALLSLSQVHGRIVNGEVSPIEVVDAVLERIAALEPQLNAFVTVMGEKARADAQIAQEALSRGEPVGPLHGVPISVKDLFATTDVPTTAGSGVLVSNVPSYDATVVRRLRAAGAIIIGKTNMAEFAYGETHPDFGPTRNPWNLAYGTNGSSGGSAAAVAAGLGYGSFGSDSGGSIRLPAAFCGIVGLKPTYGLVSRSGVIPLSWSLDHVGPMARTVRDCARLLQAVVGVDDADPTSARSAIPDFLDALERVPSPVTIGVVQPSPGDRVRPEVWQITQQAVATLEQLGFDTVPVALPFPEHAARALMAMLYVEASTYHRSWLQSCPEKYSANTRQRLELGTLVPGHVYVTALQARRIIMNEYRSLFRNIDVLATPAAPIASYRLDGAPVAPVSGEHGDRMNDLIRFSGPFDLTGLPALSVPCGVTGEGLPVGLQLAGPAFSEAVLMSVAHVFQEATKSDIRPTAAGNVVAPI